MVLMRCKKPNSYGGKRNRFGDELRVREGDVRAVSALGWFELVEEQAPPAPAAVPQQPAKAEPVARREDGPSVSPFRPTYKPAAHVAETARDAADESEAKPKRTYRRRDMTAEGSDS